MSDQDKRLSQLGWIVNPIKVLIDLRPFGARMITDNVKSRMPINLEGKTICWALGGGLGDIYFLTCLLRYAKRHCQKIRNVCALPQQYLDAFVGNPYIDHLMVYDKHNDPDVSIGFDYTFDFGHAITKHELAEKITGVQAYFKWIDNDFDLTSLTKEDQMPVVTLNPMYMERVQKFISDQGIVGKVNIALQLRASSLLRSWLPEFNRKLANLLGDKGYNVLLFDNISTNRFTGKNIIWVGSRLPSIAEVILLIDFCDVVVGPDSSFIQIAQGLQKPFVGLYGAFPQYIRTIEDDPSNFSIEGKPERLDCQPCFAHRDICPHQIPAPCMEAITPNIVFASVEKALSYALAQKPNAEAKLKAESVHSQVCCPYCNSSMFVSLVEYSVDVLKCDRSLIEKFKDHEFKICLKCRSIYLSGAISNKGMHALYSDKSYHSESNIYLNDMQIQTNQTYAIIEKYVRQAFGIDQVEIVNLGCGVAAFDRFLIDKDKQIRVIPYDISTQAAFIAQRSFNIEVNIADIVNDTLSRYGTYNLCIISHTLEHMNGYEIGKLLEQAKKLLDKQRGVIYIRGPNASRYYQFQPHAKEDVWVHLGTLLHRQTHISLPTIKGMSELLENHGYEILFAKETDIFVDDFEIVAKPLYNNVDPLEHGITTMTRKEVK